MKPYPLKSPSCGGAVGAVSLLTSLLIAGQVLAAPPGNDDFAAPLGLTGDVGQVTVVTTEATKEAGEPNHAGNAGGASAWFEWTATAGGLLNLDTFDSDFDTLLAVYQGTDLETLVQLAANDDFTGFEPFSAVSVPVTAGATYRIAVDGYGGETGNALLYWSFQPTAANDAFAGAVPLSGLCGTLRNTSAGTTREPDEPEHAGNPGGRSVWFKWTAPSDTLVAFSTRGSGFDTLLGVYTGETVGTLSELGSNDDAVGGATTSSEVRFDAESGVTYYIAIDGYDGASGLWRLTWQVGLSEHDNFSGAQVLVGGTGTREDCTIMATREPGEPGAAGSAPGKSLWYTWTPPADGTYVFNTFGSRFDTVLSVFIGDELAALSVIVANDDDIDSVASRLTFNAEAGVTYRIVLDGYTGASGVAANGYARLNWSGTPAPNDQQAEAEVISGDHGVAEGSNFFAAREVGEPLILGYDGGRSVWYSWTPETSGITTVTTIGSFLDTLVAVYVPSEGAGLGLVAAGDDIDALADVRQSAVSFEAEAGVTYLITVDGYAGEEGPIRLTWDMAPVLSVSADGADLLIQWAGPIFHLEGATEIDGEWTPIPGASPVRVPKNGPHRFFRAVFP